MPAPKSYVGQKFARLKVISDAPRRTLPCGQVVSYSVCRCDCGTMSEVRNAALVNGSVKSCGCLQREVAAETGRNKRTHGMSKTQVYSVWNEMVNRATNKTHQKADYYTGRGIGMCEQWRKFENFINDMGERPPGMTVERRDNNKGYCPENCYWGTRKQQARNRRSNITLTIGGVTGCLKALAEHFGQPYERVWNRIHNLKWSPERALLSPIVVHL